MRVSERLWFCIAIWGLICSCGDGDSSSSREESEEEAATALILDDSTPKESLEIATQTLASIDAAVEESSGSLGGIKSNSGAQLIASVRFNVRG